MQKSKKEKRTKPASKSSLCQNDDFKITQNRQIVKSRCSLC